MVFPSTYFPRQQKNGCTLQVRCMAEESQKEQKSSPVSAPPSPPQPTSPSASPKVSTKFTDVLAFSGPAPERINGRLAMIGFVAAMAVELAKGDDVAAQLANGGLTWFLGTTAVLSLASLIPLFKGVDVQSKSKGLMTSDAELWNGRFAMLGLVALVFTEYVKGGALI
ncbi:PREDICTED: early light-induced protein 1, chloroplastic-like [Nelumbo nucifera]|nr:PREDICTED: early light-induced protein 1, chloroplastic-like [Nelumbo nucifera]